MTHFLRHAFDPGLLQPLQQAFTQQIAPQLSPAMLAGGRQWQAHLPKVPFDVFSYNQAPLLWVSGANARGFGWFQAFFDALQLQLVLPEATRLYCGFFVVSNRAPEPLWHDDYVHFANAYTLLTPLNALAPSHGHLLYYPPTSNPFAGDETGQTQSQNQGQEQPHTQSPAQPQQYHYTPGEALIIGHKLLHSTAPYPPDKQLRVLVSLTFGGEDMHYWPALKPVLQGQSFYYHRPCGHTSHQLCLCAWQTQKKPRSPS